MRSFSYNMIRSVRAIFADWEQVLRGMSYREEDDTWFFIIDGKETHTFKRDGSHTQINS